MELVISNSRKYKEHRQRGFDLAREIEPTKRIFMETVNQGSCCLIDCILFLEEENKKLKAEIKLLKKKR